MYEMEMQELIFFIFILSTLPCSTLSCFTLLYFPFLSSFRFLFLLFSFYFEKKKKVINIPIMIVIIIKRSDESLKGIGHESSI